LPAGCRYDAARLGDGEQLGRLPARFAVLPAALTVVVSAGTSLG
jgi:diacylglycerol kinase family enzyme